MREACYPRGSNSGHKTLNIGLFRNAGSVFCFGPQCILQPSQIHGAILYGRARSYIEQDAFLIG